ncbi:unnamed protein product [Porites evermanni]|uniref:Uncharacterized protein n=1 Tax=Porites evermanni TaxID=104178 RepID=A0ABN8LEU8_9CNID|nr:unnamed protein product [Porites evermanni]
MALRNAILLGLKNPKVYQKCLEEDQDLLTAERVVEIATLLYNSDSKPAHPRSQCPAKDVTSHKCRKKGNYKKCCKSKTGKQGTTGEPRQVQVHGLQAPLTGVNKPTCEVLDDAVILNGKSHSLPITKEYVLSEF